MDRLSRSIYELAVQNLMMYRILFVAFLLIARVKVTQSVFTRALTVSVSFDAFPNMSYVFLPMKQQNTLFLRPIKVKFVVQTYMGFIKGLYCIFSPCYTHFCNVCFSSKINDLHNMGPCIILGIYMLNHRFFISSLIFLDVALASIGKRVSFSFDAVDTQ